MWRRRRRPPLLQRNVLRALSLPRSGSSGPTTAICTSGVVVKAVTVGKVVMADMVDTRQAVRIGRMTGGATSGNLHGKSIKARACGSRHAVPRRGTSTTARASTHRRRRTSTSAAAARPAPCIAPQHTPHPPPPLLLPLPPHLLRMQLRHLRMVQLCLRPCHLPHHDRLASLQQQQQQQRAWRSSQSFACLPASGMAPMPARTRLKSHWSPPLHLPPAPPRLRRLHSPSRCPCPCPLWIRRLCAVASAGRRASGVRRAPTSSSTPRRVMSGALSGVASDVAKNSSSNSNSSRRWSLWDRRCQCHCLHR